MRTDSRRGQTLIEMLVVCALFLLALGTVLELFNYGTRMFNQTASRSDAQRQTLTLIGRFLRDFNRAPWASVGFAYPSGSPATGDLAASFQSPVDANGNVVQDPDGGTPFLQATVFYFVDRPSGTIRRLYVPLPEPTRSATSLDPATLIGQLTLTGSVPEATPVLSWQLLDPVGGQPTTLATNPARFAVVTNCTGSPPLRLEFRAKLYQ